MKVVHFCHSFSPLSETFIYDYITGLEKYNIDNYVLTIKRVNEDQRPFKKVEVINIPWWNIKRFLKTAKDWIKGNDTEISSWFYYRKQMKTFLKKIKPDLIHAQFGDQGVLIEPIARELNIPLIVTFHGYDISILVQKTKWINLYQSLFNTANALIGVSNHICTKLTNLGADQERVKLLHNGIDLSKFSPKALSDYAGKSVTYIFIGRFVEKKAPIILLKSFKYFLDKYGIKNVRLKMIGDGPLLDKSKRYVIKNKLEDSVSFLGFVDHKEIPKILRLSDIYVQHCIKARNGDEEGMGVTLAEASATGLPVITTNHNGFPDVVLQNKTGYLVEEGNYKEMGEKMYYLYQHPQIRKKMGEKGRAHVNRLFDKSNQIEKLSRLYKQILA